MSNRSYTSELTLLAIIVVCLLATWKVNDPSTLLSNAIAGLLGYIAKEPLNATSQEILARLPSFSNNKSDSE